MAKLNYELKGDKNLLHKAQWEHKTNNIIHKNMVTSYFITNSR